MTWPEIEKVLPELDVVLLPVGSVEQHGPHLPVDNDIFIARALAEEIARKGQEEKLNIALAVSLPLGISVHHMSFPGTVTLTPELYHTVLREVLLSYQQHGLQHILLINGHGGNACTIQTCLENLKEEIPWSLLEVFQYWEVIREKGSHLLDSQHMFHAGEDETSLSMALGQRVLEDELVNSLSASPQSDNYNLLQSEPPAFMPPIEQISSTGVVGNSQVASLEKGQKLLKIIVEEALHIICDKSPERRFSQDQGK